MMLKRSDEDGECCSSQFAVDEARTRRMYLGGDGGRTLGRYREEGRSTFSRYRNASKKCCKSAQERIFFVITPKSDL